MAKEDLASHTALAATTALYAAYLDTLESSYHPNRTIWTVVAGTAITGAGVALRYALGVPDAPPRSIAWWCWRQVFYHFITSGSVIAAWQFGQAARLERERHGTARTRGGRGS